MVGSYEDADDITQEVFIKAYNSLSKFQAKASFFTWIYRITLNICYSYLRKRKRRYREISLSSTDKDGRSFEKNIKSQVIENENPGVEAEKKERQFILKKAIVSLPVKYREIIILKDIEGLNYEEISAVLGCAVGSAKSRVHRARHLLRNKLAPLWEEGM
jgi:RNA polymerase sigma-70 factor (ECF subfamily)